MNQELLPVGGLRPISSFYRRYVLALNDAVDSVGLGTAAGRCGVRPPDLRDMLDGTKGRRIPADIGAAILDMVSGDLRDAIVSALKDMNGLTEPESDADYIRRLERALSDFGRPGREELAKCQKAARR